MDKFEPGYIRLAREGKLAERVQAANKILESCTLCPRQCQVNRLAGEQKFCRMGKLPVVSSFGPHFGEERPLVGRSGSGTIFFTYCNLGCIFCQNYDISHLGHGEEISLEKLAGMMLFLQKVGCHNINFVTPTHATPQILAALEIAIEQGLHLPLVYNCGGYESIETIRLLDGIFDIYMPDFKYADPEVARRLSQAKDYPERAREAVKEMHRQVGDLVVDNQGIALRGLLVRHLVLPQGLAGTREVTRFLAQELSPHTYINVMDQYRPCFKAGEYPDIDRRPTYSEFQEAVRIAREQGLYRLDGMTI
ncbi:MAG: radical SAM protein [Deltaproteobacteria bacterium]|nr:MAG: radical SAM protein [Deltaproteobacteria bacterium]